MLWAHTLRRWDQAILGYFQYPMHHGFTQGCHTKVNLLKRLSYGFRNAEVYRRKVLLGFLPCSFETLAPHFLTYSPIDLTMDHKGTIHGITISYGRKKSHAIREPYLREKGPYRDGHPQ